MTETVFIEQRLDSDGLSTVSELLLGGQRVAFTLEPGPVSPAHPRKLPGRYRLVLRTEGQIYDKYRLRFPDFFVGVPQILVPGRQWIEVHIGNSMADTEGCSLLGAAYESPAVSRSRHYEVVRSEEAFRRAYPMIAAACQAGPAWWETRPQTPSLDVTANASAPVAEGKKS